MQAVPQCTNTNTNIPTKNADTCTDTCYSLVACNKKAHGGTKRVTRTIRLGAGVLYTLVGSSNSNDDPIITP